MNTRAAILTMAAITGLSWTAALAQQVTPAPFQSSGRNVTRPRQPGGELRNGGGFLYTRHAPQDRVYHGDGGLRGSNLRPDWFFQDSDASSLAAIEDNNAVVQPVDNWLPPTAGDRDATNPGDSASARNGLRDAFGAPVGNDPTSTTSISQDENRRSPDSSSFSGSWEDRVRFRVGMSHLAPKVEMRCDLRGGALGLSVNAHGDVQVALAPARDGRTVFSAAITPAEGRYDVGYRIRF